MNQILKQAGIEMERVTLVPEDMTAYELKTVPEGYTHTAPGGTKYYFGTDNDPATVHAEGLSWENEPGDGGMVYDAASLGLTNSDMS